MKKKEENVEVELTAQKTTPISRRTRGGKSKIPVMTPPKGFNTSSQPQLSHLILNSPKMTTFVAFFDCFEKRPDFHLSNQVKNHLL